MVVKVSVRPGRRTEISGLPFLPRGGNFALLSEAIDASRSDQVKYDRARGVFTVSKPHTTKIVEALASHFGRVRIAHHGGTTKCVYKCWTGNPDRVWECECSCAGVNHGSQHPLGRIVSEDGPHGALSVASEGVREYEVFG